MAGSNAFAFTGTAFVPTDRNLTATISARGSSPSFSTVSKAYTLDGGASTQVWIGFPPTPGTPTITNPRTGTFPNLTNSIVVSWTCDTSTIIASFDVFVKIGPAAYDKVATVSAETRTYTYGNIPQDVQYSFYIKASGTNGLNTTSPASSITLSTPSTVGTLSSSKTTTSATVSWTVTAGVYQRFHVYASTTYLGEVLATESGTSYSFARTGLSQSTAYNFRVYAQNYNGHWSTFSELDVTTNTLPIPSISWSDSSATKYSDWSITWAGTAGITYQPQYYTSSWLDNGGTLSGAGTKTSPTRTVGYGSTLYMRVYVTDAFGATGYTSQIQVTAGRPLITESSWKDTSTQNYSASYDAFAPNWGNELALAFTCNSSTDFKFNTTLEFTAGVFSIVGLPLSSPARVLTLSSSTTNKNRRAGVRTSDGLIEIFSLDGYTSERTAYYGVGGAGTDWHTSAGSGAVTYYFGVRDMPTYFDGNWRYGDGILDNWNLGAQTRFTVIVNASRRDYTTTTTQTQVNSTYA
jgi:hypothetical protein